MFGNNGELWESVPNKKEYVLGNLINKRYINKNIKYNSYLIFWE